MANHTKIILLCGLLFGLLVAGLVRHEQLSVLEGRFAQEVKRYGTILKDKLELNELTLVGIESLFKASREVTRQEFNVFVQPFLDHTPFIQALEWIPRVPHEERQELERRARQDGLSGFKIRERASGGEMVPAQQRAEYYPVYFMQPHAGNETALGFDLASHPVRLKSLKQAIDTGKPVATSKITLVQETGNQSGLLIFLPIYLGKQVPESVERRRQDIAGFIVGVYRIGDMIEEIIQSNFTEHINLAVYQGDEAHTGALMFGNPQAGALFETQEVIPVSGKRWTLIWQAAKDYKPFSDNDSVLAGIATFVIFILIAVIFQMNVSKTRRVEQLVEQRTKELEAKNLELEEFTYRTSHDLKAPLVNIRGLSGIMKMDLDDGDYDEVLANIDKIGTLSFKLESVVSNIVEAAKVDGLKEEYEAVDIAEVMRSIQENLNYLIDEKQIDVRVSIDTEKPLITKRNLIHRVLENLISNAIKYCDPDKPLRFVKVAVRDIAGKTQIKVWDNGLGIPKENQDDVFSMFKRFHQSSSFGTGLGLYLVKKNLDKINGEISLESSPEGTVFTISLPQVQTASTIAQS